MRLYSSDKEYKLYHGSMLDMLDVIEPNSIDSIVTDPPYELGFMNKGWDSNGVAFQKETWEKCYTALKSGGYLVAFGGTRTFHRIACAIEDAGFEIRDTIMWLYGSGFPKSLNIGKQVEAKILFNDASGRSHKMLNGEKVHTKMWAHHWNYENGVEPKDYSELSQEKVIDVEFTTEEGRRWSGWGTALKPAYEPIIVARKPCKGTTTDNVLKYGVGGLNINECRVGNETHTVNINDFSNQHGNQWGNGEPIGKLGEREVVGRFPSNVILTYDDTDEQEVCGGMPNTVSNGGSTSMPDFADAGQKNTVNKVGFNDGETASRKQWRGAVPMDSGSAARYFYCAKASKKDRDEGLFEFETVQTGALQGGRVEGSAGSIMQNADGGTRVNPYAGTGAPKKNTHPTVKPTELMQYLVRLVTPKGGTVLDPFNGSGSTGKAVLWENKERGADYKYIGIELTEEYLPIAKARLDYMRTVDYSQLEPSTNDTSDQVVSQVRMVTRKLF